ncbi:CsbD family protein [Streptococcus dysgalactiae subsp. dysgalactiae]|nr:CsbD family protein [Streptococcus dysgalactiae subsp. dysgalactiae]
MSEEKFDAKLDQAKGGIKEGAGKLIGDKELQSEGAVEKALGKGKEFVDDVKDAVKGAVDSLKK